MTMALQSVGSAHGLHVDQLGALEDETLMVMLGFNNPAEFPAQVAATLNLDEQTAEAIARELSERLFIPIRNSMRAYMEAQLKKVSEPAAAPSTPAAVTAAPQARPIAAQPAIIPTSGGGKIIMPVAVQPVLHPTDSPLTAVTVTVPQVTDFSAPGALQAPSVPATQQYASDPYREPVE